MDLLELKRWHWALLGLIVGGLLAASRLFYGQDIDRDGQETISLKFEAALLATEQKPLHLDDWDNGDVYLTGVRVYPATVDDSPEGRTSKKPKSTAQAAAVETGPAQIQWVMGTIVRKNLWRNPARFSSKPFKYRATIPYAPSDRTDLVHNQFMATSGKKSVAGYSPPKEKSYASIIEYFKEVNHRFGDGSVAYRFVWWESPTLIKYGYPMAGLVLIGGIWPSLLSLLLGAGLVHKKQKDNLLDMSRYSGKSKSAARPAVVVSAAEQARLDALNAKLEGNLTAGARPGPAKVASDQPVEAAIVRLDGGPLKPAGTLDPDTAPAKSFGTSGGAFYPTEIHIEKKD